MYIQYMPTIAERIDNCGAKQKALTEVRAFQILGGASLIRTGDLRIMIPSL